MSQNDTRIGDTVCGNDTVLRAATRGREELGYFLTGDEAPG
jgi:hypothetical protein